jgi:hypothetical protein
MTIQIATLTKRRDTFYELPDSEGLLEVLGAVPPDWVYVDGGLEKREVIGGRSLILSSRKTSPSDHSIRVWKESELTPARISYLLRRNSIARVSFNWAGIDGRPLPYSDCLNLARAAIQDGYDGSLYFHRLGDGTDVTMALDHEGFGFDGTKAGGYLKILMGHKGDKANVTPILEAIKNLGLKRIGR